MRNIYLPVKGILTILPAAAGKGYQEKKLSYHPGGVLLNGWLIFPHSLHKPAPAVIVAHELSQAKVPDAAVLGYIAFCSDMYVNGQSGEMPQEAMKHIGMIYKDPGLLRFNFEAALN